MPSSRREFVRLCTLSAAAVGLGPLAAARFVEAAEGGARPSVIWLQFQECTGCTESLLRTAHPAIDTLILDLISLDYHETLLAAAGHQADAALKQAMHTNAGKYVCIVEGAIPIRDQGVYCMIGGRTAIEILTDVASHAGAVIAIGSCASWGGVPSAAPNPTGSVGVHEILKGKTVVNIPGCPANPYNLLGTVLQFATYGTLPALDKQQRPLFAYADTIHEHCPRRAHFDAADSPTSSATRDTARATASTSSVAKDRSHTPTARCSTSATSMVPGRSVSAIRASAVPSRTLRSRCRFTRPSASTVRCHPTPTRRFVRRRAASARWPPLSAVPSSERRRLPGMWRQRS
jgi:NiFe hydrogenase small subunit HydA